MATARPILLVMGSECTTFITMRLNRDNNKNHDSSNDSSGNNE